MVASGLFASPPIVIATYFSLGHDDSSRVEVCWNKDDPAGRFFKYRNAPSVTDISEFSAMIGAVDRPTAQARDLAE